MTATAPELRAAGFARLACPLCGWRFFTTGGRERHLAACRRHAESRRARAVRRETGLRVTELNNSRRYRCGGCDKTSTPSGIALHQHYSGHEGRVELS